MNNEPDYHDNLFFDPRRIDNTEGIRFAIGQLYKAMDTKTHRIQDFIWDAINTLELILKQNS